MGTELTKWLGHLQEGKLEGKDQKRERSSFPKKQLAKLTLRKQTKTRRNEGKLKGKGALGKKGCGKKGGEVCGRREGIPTHALSWLREKERTPN